LGKAECKKIVALIGELTDRKKFKKSVQVFPKAVDRGMNFLQSHPFLHTSEAANEGNC
jgi:hypothetical protein